METLKFARFKSKRMEPWPWVGKEKALALLDIFDEAGLLLRRYGTSDARTFPLENNMETYLQLWNERRYIILKAPTPWRLLVSVWMFGIGASYITVFINDKYFEDPLRTNAFIRLVKSIYTWGNIDHGYVVHEDEYEKKNIFRVGVNEISGGNGLEFCLPGIYWINLFGPRYVEWFGEHKFQTLSAYNKERMPDGGQLVLTRPTLLPFNDKASVNLEKGIKRYLGNRAFFDKNHPDWETDAPNFAKERGIAS